MDTVNEESIQHGGQALTTLNSSWLHQVCIECDHTFRLGDEVDISKDGVVRHSSALLPCAKPDQKPDDIAAETTNFFQGMDETWPPPENMTIVRLEKEHPLLAPPDGKFRRHKCVVCGHTFRLHDHVVICPCRANDKDMYNPSKKCMVAIHRDLIHGLHCLDAWNPNANNQKFCPVTLRKLDE
jgi:hypothetical protein